VIKKSKVEIVGNFNDLSVEGLIKISSAIRAHFQSKGILSENTNSRTVLSIHSAGFFETLKYRSLRNKKIYSLHSFLKVNIFRELYDSIQFKFLFFDSKKDHYTYKDRLFKTILRLISMSIPLCLKRQFFKKMDCIIVPSKAVKKQLKLKNCKIIRHGINCNKFINTKEPRKKIRIAFIGHPSTAKGLLEAVISFSKIQHQNVEKIICLTSTNKKIRKWINRIDPSIILKGHSQDIVKEYNLADIIVLPFRHKGSAIATPLVLLEAMACERAIVTSDLQYIKDISGDSVMYTKPYSIASIVKGINHLIYDPKLRKTLGKRARQKVTKHHNVNNMLKEYYDFFSNKLSS
jgi:glycosyltransferase involved in cell wall biosynthesis